MYTVLCGNFQLLLRIIYCYLMSEPVVGVFLKVTRENWSRNVVKGSSHVSVEKFYVK